jgi:PAS domain S-box-containing protein
MNFMFLIPAFLAMSSTLALFNAARLVIWARTPQNVAGAFLLTSMAFNLMGYLFQLINSDIQVMLFWQEVQVIGLNLVYPASLIFVLYFTGYGKRVKPVLVAALALFSAFPIVISLLPATSAWFVQVDGVMAVGELHMLKQQMGWVVLFTTAIAQVEGVFSIYYLVRQLPRVRRGYRRYFAILLFSQIFAFAAIWMEISGANPFAPLSVFNLSFIPTAIVITWTIFELRVGHTLPQMREKVVETMHDSVIVLDGQNRAAYLNPAATQTLQRLPGQPQNLPLAQLAPELAAYLEARPAAGTAEKLAAIGEMSYSVGRSVIMDWKGDISGQVLVLRNVTDRERMEQTLQAHSAELSRSNAFTQALSSLSARAAASADLEQVYNTLRDELHRLGLDFCVGLRTSGQSGYAIEYLSLDSAIQQVVEKYTGLQAKGFRLPELGGLEMNGPGAIEEGGAIYVPTLSSNLPLVFRQFPKVLEDLLRELAGISLDKTASFTFRLNDQGEEIGMLSVWGPSLRREDLAPLSTFAAQVSAAIQKARLIQNEHNRVEELESTNRLILALTQVAARLEANLSVEQIMEIIGAELKQLETTCVIATVDPASDELVGQYTSVSPALWNAAQHITGVSLDAFHIPYKEWLALDPGANGPATIIKDPLQITSKIISKVPKVILKKAVQIVGITSRTPAVWLPLRANDRDLGIMVLWGIYEPQRYLSVFTLFARQVATAIEKARLMTDLETLKSFNEGIVQGVAEAIVLFDADYLIKFANPAATKLIGLPSEKLVGMRWDCFIPAAEREEAEKRLFFEEKVDLVGVELNLQDHDGRIIPVLANIQTILQENQPVGALVSLMDIQQRIEAEQQIRASIEEKEALIKEIHHRVKNNLQIISSLLSLQASRIKDKSMVEAFRESQNRVRSMALIHEKLYRSDNLARIRFDEYIRDLTSFLIHSYSDNAHKVKLEIRAEPVNLDMDTAIPCGLIINELVTNSIKHGFSKDPSDAHFTGHILVRLALLSEQQINLSVEDNGPGFPADLDFRKTNSLGLQLVTSLTHQLDGEVLFQTNHGAHVEISFTNAGAYLS